MMRGFTMYFCQSYKVQILRNVKQEGMDFILAYEYRNWVEYSPLSLERLRNELCHCLMTHTRRYLQKVDVLTV
jgi:hypothetical protein